MYYYYDYYVEHFNIYVTKNIFVYCYYVSIMLAHGIVKKKPREKEL